MLCMTSTFKRNGPAEYHARLASGVMGVGEKSRAGFERTLFGSFI